MRGGGAKIYYYISGWNTCPYYQEAVQLLKKKYGCDSVIKFDNETPQEFIESKALLSSMFPSMDSFFSKHNSSPIIWSVSTNFIGGLDNI